MTDETFPTDRLHRILNAVETIEVSLNILAQKQLVGREAYRTDPETQDIVERRFVKMTEAAIDIATEVAKHERGSPPSSNPESMRTLDELGVLSPTTAEKMAQGARFRNVLAHTYGHTIDHDVVYNALQDLERYREFVVAVRDYFESIDAFDQQGH